MRHDDDAGSEEAIVREVAVALAQPYGIIHARERALHIGSATGDPRYRCLILLRLLAHLRRRPARPRARLPRAREPRPIRVSRRALRRSPRSCCRSIAAASIRAPATSRRSIARLQAARRAVELEPGSARALSGTDGYAFPARRLCARARRRREGGHAQPVPPERARLLRRAADRARRCREGRPLRARGRAGGRGPARLARILSVPRGLSVGRSARRRDARLADRVEPVLARSAGARARRRAGRQAGARARASRPARREPAGMARGLPREIRKLFPAERSRFG